MKIGIVGSRRRNEELDYQLVKRELIKACLKYRVKPILVSGGCPKGADSFVERLCEELKLPEPIIFPADWNKHGKGAGFIRNTDIARESEVLIAVRAVDLKGGTEDTIKKFQKFHPDGELIFL